MARATARYFQDPIHGTISVTSALLQRLIDTRAVQRLKHVRQLGTSYFSFPGAEHSRFSHSLGCMHLMERVLDHLIQNEGLRLEKAHYENAQIAALLHDIGHCAFSHTLESALEHDHEKMTARLICEDAQLKKILGKRVKAVLAIFKGSKGSPEALHSLISSQLDVDRLDYLVRDAYHTGVNSGRVDLGRLISSLTVHRGQIVVKEKAWLALEEYFLARYFMYWKVYFHKTSRGLELLLNKLIVRARLGFKAGRRAGLTPALIKIFENPSKVAAEDFLDHDDSDLLVAIKAWRKGQDPILADLCDRFLSRRKFKLVREVQSKRQVLKPGQRRRIRAMLEKKYPGGANEYLVEDNFGGRPYDVTKPVMLLTASKKMVDLASRSTLVREVSHLRITARYYVPEENVAAVRRLLR